MTQNSSEMDQTDTEFQRVAELVQKLKADDVDKRIEANESLLTIASVLGEDRTRTELIPFLSECVDDEDNIILVLAEKLGELSEFVGGPSHLHLLLSPLISLASADEATVREMAVNSMIKVIGKMEQTDAMNHGVSLVKELTESEFYTARVSACGIIYTVYARISHERDDRMDTDDEASSKRTTLRQLFLKLCSDDTPMVKRMAASKLGKLAHVVESKAVLEEFLLIFEHMARSEQDSVRLQTAENCIAFANELPKEARMMRIAPELFNVASDQSWRVRWSVANRFCEAAVALSGGDLLAPSLCDTFKKLLQDPEAEVRTASCFGISKVGALMSEKNLTDILLPCLGQLVNDESEHVRAALANIICDVAPLIGKDLTLGKLVPLLLQQLRDSNSEVRLNIISKVHTINKVIGMEYLAQSSLLPAVVGLAGDDKWRVRKAIIMHTPLLAQQLGTRFFTEQLLGICLGWLADHVHDVRLAAADNLCKLCTLFGEEWTKTNVIPKLVEMHKNESYLERLTTLAAINVLSDDIDAEFLQRDVLPIVLEMASDPVPNVRFNVSKALEKLASKLNMAVIEGSIRPTLTSLSGDNDRDVRYFSKKAIETLS